VHSGPRPEAGGAPQVRTGKQRARTRAVVGTGVRIFTLFWTPGIALGSRPGYIGDFNVRL
jgi:hypothetical protein